MAFLRAAYRHPIYHLIIRLIVGGLFLLTGILKASSPPEEFAAVIRVYQILPEAALVPLATVLPWIEMISGAFLLIGLFTHWSLRAVTGMLIVFTAALGAAWIRGIDLSDCGCFGSLGWKETGPEAFVRNIVLMVCLLPVLRSRDPAWSLDRYFRRGGSTES